jgi:hypothetical protein
MVLVHIHPDMTVGDLIVGVGTAALASFTFLLASGTRRQIRLTRESIEAIDRPFVIVSRRRKHLAHLTGNVMEFAVSNLGKGPGIVEEVELLSSSGANVFPERMREVRSLAVSNVADLTMELGDVPIEGDELTLRVWYRSASGTCYRTDSLLRLAEDGRFSYHGHKRSPESHLPHDTDLEREIPRSAD